MRNLIFCAIFALGAMFAQENVESTNAVKTAPKNAQSTQGVRTAPKSTNRANVQSAPKSTNAQNRAKNLRAKSAQTTETTKSTESTQVLSPKKALRTNSDRVEPSGFFIGAGLGITPSFPFENYYIEDVSFIMFALDLMGGYKWFFGEGGFGMRLHLDYNPNFSFLGDNENNTPINDTYALRASNKKYTTHNVALNYDLLFNWVKTRGFKFGMLLGLGLGANMSDYDGHKRTDFALQGNLGFRFVILNHHAIEVLGTLRFAIGDVEDCYNQVCETQKGKLTSLEMPVMLRYVYGF